MKQGFLFTLCLFILCLPLCACSVNSTKTQTKIAINEIKAIEHDLNQVQHKLPEECLSLVGGDLNRISVDLNNTKKSIEQINTSCTQEKSLLKAQNRIKNVWIILLLACVGGLWYYILKRK